MAWQSADAETISNLFSDDSTLRVLGFQEDEWWTGPNEFLGIFEAQSHDMPDWTIEIQKVEAFEEGGFGWVSTSPPLSTIWWLLCLNKRRSWSVPPVQKER